MFNVTLDFSVNSWGLDDLFETKLRGKSLQTHHSAGKHDRGPLFFA